MVQPIQSLTQTSESTPAVLALRRLQWTAAAAAVWVVAATQDIFRSSFQQAMWMGIIAAFVDLVVSVAVSLATKPKPESELVGLVKGLEATVMEEPAPWFKRPVPLGIGALVLAGLMYIPFMQGG